MSKTDKTQCYHKDPCFNPFSGIGVGDGGAFAKIHLGGLCLSKVQHAGDFGLCLVQFMHQSAYRRIAAGKTELLNQRLVYGGSANTGVKPLFDLLFERQAQRILGRILGLLFKHLSQGLIIGQRNISRDCRKRFIWRSYFLKLCYILILSGFFKYSFIE